MIKQKHPNFNKIIPKNIPKESQNDETQHKKTRRSYFKLNQPNLTNIIKNIQHSVKQLKNFHESLTKNTSLKLKKSTSLHEIHKLKSSTQFKSKDSMLRSKHLKKFPQNSDQNKENISSNINHQAIESTVSKNFGQNGSTMLSVHNADVEEVKKAYQFAYGKETTNIVDLYHFFKKNSDKSLRFNHGSIQMSSFPHAEHSQDMAKSRQNIYHKKSSEFLNVIVEDKSQKQPQLNQDGTEKSCSFSISRLSGGRTNPTMEEIFKGGCPDLANVYDFIKKRRISVKNYMNWNQNGKENKAILINQVQTRPIVRQNKSQFEQKPEEIEQIHNEAVLQKPFFNKQQSPAIKSLQTKREHKFSKQEEGITSDQKYFPSRSSKKSNKSSIKKSKKKMDENIESNMIQEFKKFDINEGSSIKKTDKARNQDLNENVFDFDSFLMDNQTSGNKKKTKGAKKEQSFDGSSISVRSGSRIIELDFIPLDL